VAFYGYGDIAGDWYSEPDPFYNTFDRLTEADAHTSIGITELVDGSADPRRRDYYLWCRQNGLWPHKVGGHDPVTERNWFTPYSPAENVSTLGREYPPTLLLHGNADTDVPYAQSVHMAARLAEAGIEHSFITIPDGPHGFDHNPETAETPGVAGAHDSVIEFLSTHV
jgi:acetyl esterase/lipase